MATLEHASGQRRDRPWGGAALLFVLVLVVHGLFAYGGIRSPDAEVVFRTADALASEGSFAVSEELGWQGFGLPRGRDGRRYSLFGPGQPLAMSPCVALARAVNRTGWYRRVPDAVPVSHYVGDGLAEFLAGRRPARLEAHALRALLAPFNVVVSALCALVFLLVARRLVQHEAGAWTAALAFAFGSLLLPYSGTFFSEPLATLLALLALLPLLRNDELAEGETRGVQRRLATSGLLLGLSTATHITGILCAPFLLLYGMAPFLKGRRRVPARGAADAACFLAGLGLVLALLGAYNHTRFGSVWETGRSAEPGFDYSSFVAPWSGLLGLLWSGGKGVLWYCPAVLLGLFWWRHLHHRKRFLSITLLAMAGFRLLFLASRSDWHGGFSLGPRYLVMAVPFLLLPVACGIDRLLSEQRWRGLLAASALIGLCVAQQLLFALGEPFSFLHEAKWRYEARGINVFADDLLYTSWDCAPVLHLLDGERGPLALRAVPLSNHALWALLALGALALLGVWYRRLRAACGRGGA